jgi:hypothetical protein
MVSVTWTQPKEAATPAADAPKTPVPSSITTAPTVETGIGALEFTDGYPTRETATKLRDHLDYLHGVEAFMNSIQGVSTYAVREGFLAPGSERFTTAVAAT